MWVGKASNTHGELRQPVDVSDVSMCVFCIFPHGSICCMWSPACTQHFQQMESHMCKCEISLTFKLFSNVLITWGRTNVFKTSIAAELTVQIKQLSAGVKNIVINMVKSNRFFFLEQFDQNRHKPCFAKSMYLINRSVFYNDTMTIQSQICFSPKYMLQRGAHIFL